MNMTEKPEYKCKAGLKLRGWTNGLIKTFLPEPDKTVPNPHYKRASKMCLYRLERVAAIEARDDFKKAKQKVATRRKAAKKAVRTKTKRLVRATKELNVTVVKKPLQQVRQEAIDWYNQHRKPRHNRYEYRWDDEESDSDFEDLDWEVDEYEWQPASLDSAPAFLDRITVNHIRHQLTTYDGWRRGLRGRVGTAEGHLALQERVFDEIAKVYPELAKECQRQLQDKHSADSISEVESETPRKAQGRKAWDEMETLAT